jgi:LacI family transcriptional regulator
MATIKDVARVAGVSTATVSRVIQDSSLISFPTKKKVKKAMEILGYSPNQFARNLVTGRSHSIGIIFPPTFGEEDAFLLNVLKSINEKANQQGMTISLATASTTQKVLENVQFMVKNRQVDGFIFLYSKKDDLISKYLTLNKIPFVRIGMNIDNDSSISIDNNHRKIGIDAVEKLLENGHTKIGFVTNNTDELLIQKRYAGYKEGMYEHGETPLDWFVLKSNTGNVEKFLSDIRRQKLSALIVVDDRLSFEVLQLLGQIGLSVPNDISIVSMNNSPLANLLHPHLTSIDMDFQKLGETAVEGLSQLLNGNAQKKLRLIPHRIVERESIKYLKA